MTGMKYDKNVCEKGKKRAHKTIGAMVRNFLDAEN